MRSFFEPAAAPVWLKQVLTSIRAALSDIWPGPLRLKDYATTELPVAADFSAGMVWDSTLLTFRVSDGTNWLRFAVYGSGVTSFNTRAGAVTLTSGDVTTALTYTPTSVTGLTGVQSAAAFKTGLSLVKSDVGLGGVDNTADAAKNVLSATRLTTARNINGVAFDGTGAITINLSAARTIAMSGDVIWSVSFDGSANVTAAGTIQAGAVTLAKMANLAANSIIGNNSGSPATPLALTAAQVKALLAIATGDVSGLGTAATQTYTDGTWTPVLKFGGATTGITYSVQQGSYRRIGNLVVVFMEITLSSKGSATGSATITGLPFTTGGAPRGNAPMLHGNMASVGQVFGQFGAAGTTINVFNAVSGSAVAFLTDTNFTNTSLLQLMGAFPI